ncbi:hypothetical protein [Streptomyces sp. MI02-7b]|uniref:hypothetical protein n=1 Tax=Streptomyces sp. MI02-7b TaxID=462941 RepID=UPI0029A13A54|nr:hypothetical protein [Streptomyces sp. MI02-7b]MDX3077495.1 hypothetical protein [Streptomyces sp. MI02-7b]
MRRALAGRVLVATTVILLLGSCTTESGSGASDTGARSRSRATGEYAPPDSPFSREDTVVTATCETGARFAAVAVRAWRPNEWRLLAERYFAIPSDAAFGNHPGVVAVHSPLVDLCGQGPDADSPYAVDDAEFMVPRIRALFDQGFTRMAVVLRKPGTDSTRADFVTSGDTREDADRQGAAGNRDEQNAVMSPDGRSVWFTYTNSSGEKRIGSRAVQGDQKISDEGPASGHDLPLNVAGQPPRAVQANMVRPSPDGRRLTATAPHVFGTVFDTPDSSSALTRKSARNAGLLNDCVGVVGWVSDARVLCRASSGSFRVRDARSGQAVGDPISVVDPHDATVAEGMLVSADGGEFIVSVHAPNEPYGSADLSPDFRVVPTTSEGEVTRAAHPFLDVGTVFLEWL